MSYELLQQRLKHGCGTSEEALIKMKDRSFNIALQRAYNAETIIHKDEEYKAIINENRQKIEYDEKIISAPNEANLHVGSTVYVPRDNTRWVVTTEHLGEKAYFKGDIKKAIYLVSWRDEKNVKHSHWAAVRGPVETKIKSDPVKGIANHIPNNTLVVWIGQTEGTEALKRYSYLMIADKVWEVTVTDEISQPGLVELQLIEAPLNKDLDNQEDKIARDDKIIFSCTLDKSQSFKVLERISVNPNLYINGKIMTETHADKIKVFCGSDYCTVENETLLFSKAGSYEVRVGYEGITNEKIYNITVEEEKLENDEIFVIEGNQRIKPMTSTFEEYNLEYYLNGVKSDISVEGYWDIDSSFATIIEQGKDRVVLKFTNRVGNAELRYMSNENTLAKQTINVVSVFG